MIKEFPQRGIFPLLSSDVLEQIRRLGQLRHINAQQFLHTIGEPCEGISMIISGQVQVEIMEALGWESIATMSAGDMVGARAWMTGRIWRERITAVNEVTLIFLPRLALQSLVAQYPDLQRQLKRYAERHKLHHLLGGHALFQSLKHQALMELVDGASLRVLPVGGELFSPQRILAFLFLIGEGEMELSVDGVSILTLGQGEVLNLEFALGDLPPVTTARAVTHATLYALPFEDVERLIREAGELDVLWSHVHLLRSRIFNR